MKNIIEYCFEFIDFTFPVLILIPSIYINKKTPQVRGEKVKILHT